MLAPALCFEQHRGEVKHCGLSHVTVSNAKALWPNHAFKRDPPVRAFFLVLAGGGGPLNLVLLGRMESLQ